MLKQVVNSAQLHYWWDYHFVVCKYNLPVQSSQFLFLSFFWCPHSGTWQSIGRGGAFTEGWDSNHMMCSSGECGINLFFGSPPAGSLCVHLCQNTLLVIFRLDLWVANDPAYVQMHPRCSSGSGYFTCMIYGRIMIGRQEFTFFPKFKALGGALIRRYVKNMQKEWK